MIRKIVLPFMLVSTSLLCVCASISGMKSAPLEQGKALEFSGAYDRVLKATRDAVVVAGLEIDTFNEVNDSTAVIVAKKGASAFSWGELVRVVVQKTSSEQTTVRVLSKRRLATNITAKGDYADTIFSNISLALRAK